MLSVDINCDLGEDMLTDGAIMPYISSANIACGYHAGDVETMQRTVELCVQHRVAIGAHPSFADRENFGRTEMDLPEAEIYELVIQQLFLLTEIAGPFDALIHHVKPHGALYNQSAKNKTIAGAVARAVYDYDPGLVLFGLSGSYSIAEAAALGLKTASEVFADRTYRDDGSLTPRLQSHALIEDSDKAVQQALQMVQDKTVRTMSGNTVPVTADTICLHGDGKQAVAFAKAVYDAFTAAGIIIKSIQ